MIERVRVTSETNADVKYVLTFVGNESVACTCPHFNFRADVAGFSCKHMRRANALQPLTQAQLVLAHELLASR